MPKRHDQKTQSVSLEEILGGDELGIFDVDTSAVGPAGELPLTAEGLRDAPSGDLFGLSRQQIGRAHV